MHLVGLNLGEIGAKDAGIKSREERANSYQVIDPIEEVDDSKL